MVQKEWQTQIQYYRVFPKLNPDTLVLAKDKLGKPISENKTIIQIGAGTGPLLASMERIGGTGASLF